MVNLFRSDQNTVALFSLLTHEIYVTISFDEPLLFSNGLQPSYVTPNRDVMRGQRGVDETVLHDHKNNSTNGIRIIPPPTAPPLSCSCTGRAPSSRIVNVYDPRTPCTTSGSSGSSNHSFRSNEISKDTSVASCVGQISREAVELILGELPHIIHRIARDSSNNRTMSQSFTISSHLVSARTSSVKTRV